LIPLEPARPTAAPAGYYTPGARQVRKRKLRIARVAGQSPRDTGDGKLRSRFVNDVEGGFRSAPKSAESCRPHHLPDAGLARLRAQTQPDFL